MNTRAPIQPFRGERTNTAILANVAPKIHFGASDDDCWNWLGTIGKGGYGKYGLGGVPAHRATYVLWVGPIPDGLTLDHLCRNPRCVNPAHLEPCSMRENTMRGNAISVFYASRTHCKNGHEFTVANTLVTQGARRCRACARVNSRRRYSSSRNVA